MNKTLRIVPPTPTADGAVLVNGTQVLMPGGVPVPGVTKIEMVAEAGGIWAARLHCHAVLDGELIVEVMPPEVVPPALARIEAKLDALLAALAEEGDEERHEFDLDGNPLDSGERDQNESLG